MCKKCAGGCVEHSKHRQCAVELPGMHLTHAGHTCETSQKYSNVKKLYFIATVV